MLQSCRGDEKIEVWDEIALAAKKRSNVSKTAGNIRRDGKHWITSKKNLVSLDSFPSGRIDIGAFENFAQRDHTDSQAVST